MGRPRILWTSEQQWSQCWLLALLYGNQILSRFQGLLYYGFSTIHHVTNNDKMFTGFKSAFWQRRLEIHRKKS